MTAHSIAGLNLWQVADIAGRTPFFVYDGSAIQRRCHMVREGMPRGVRLHYAIKANPLPALVQPGSRLVDGLDVASLHELQLALATPTAREDISIAGPGKTDTELAAAAAAGVVVNVESAGELARLEHVLECRGQTARVALRVNPDF